MKITFYLSICLKGLITKIGITAAKALETDSVGKHNLFKPILAEQLPGRVMLAKGGSAIRWCVLH